jgi:hypothetical protein
LINQTSQANSRSPRKPPLLQQVPRVIYGAIIGLALVVALEAHPPAPGVVVATLLGTAVAVALAEIYSELVGFEAIRHRTAGRPEVGALLSDVAAVSVGIGFPSVFFLLAAAGALGTEAAFTVAKWTGLGLLGLYGYIGARASGSDLLPAFAKAVGIALIGAFLIALKALVH